MCMNHWMRAASLPLLIALLLAGCDEGTSPTADFDARSAAQAVESMAAAVASDDLEDAFASLGHASELFGGTALDLAVQSPSALDLQRLDVQGERTAAAVIPGEHFGTTFVWDTTEMGYVPSEASGAPDNGVRIVYYAVDPTTGAPATPLNALGYVDLEDQSTSASDRVSVTVVRSSDEATLADYYLDLAVTYVQSSFSVGIASAGYLSNGTDRLNFDVSQAVSGTETQVTIDQSYSLDLEGTGDTLSFSATVTADPQSESGDPETMDAEATISDGAQTVRLEISFAAGVLAGTIYSNGDAVVLVGGTPDTPTFTDLDGNDLTQEQRAALDSLWESIGDLFEFVGELFGFLTI